MGLVLTLPLVDAFKQHCRVRRLHRREACRRTSSSGSRPTASTLGLITPDANPAIGTIRRRAAGLVSGDKAMAGGAARGKATPLPSPAGEAAAGYCRPAITIRKLLERRRRWRAELNIAYRCQRQRILELRAQRPRHAVLAPARSHQGGPQPSACGRWPSVLRSASVHGGIGAQTGTPLLEQATRLFAAPDWWCPASARRPPRVHNRMR